MVAVGLVIGVSLASPSLAQPFDLSDSSRISLITIKPGDGVERRFGHSAIRVHDPSQQLDVLFNYGTFDFDNGFLPKFIHGKLDYYLSIAPFQESVDRYRVQQRPIIEQQLNLNVSQRRELYQLLVENARRENRYYRYDFLFDNCSTRIRDALEYVMSGDLKFDYEPDSPNTFRQLLDPYMIDRPFLDLGVDLILGAPVDRVVGPAEAMFLPDHLMYAFEEAVGGTNGEMKKLVAHTDTLFWIEGYKIKRTFRWDIAFFTVLLAIGVLLSYWGIRRGKIDKSWLDGFIFGTTGIAGLLIAFLWFISLHDATNYNWNLLWAWPTHLPVSILLVSNRLSISWRRRYFTLYSILTLATTIAGVAGLFNLPPTVILMMLLLVLRGGIIGWKTKS